MQKKKEKDISKFLGYRFIIDLSWLPFPKKSWDLGAEQRLRFWGFSAERVTCPSLPTCFTAVDDKAEEHS